MLKMNTKNLMVFSLIIASVLLLVSTVSAATNLVDITSVEVDGIEGMTSNDISVIAGEMVTIKVFFAAQQTAADVKFKAEIQGTKVDVESKTSSFNVEEGKRYSKTLTLKVPYELKDEASDDLSLDLKIWNGDYKTMHSNEITFRVQRPSYNADVMSISTSQTAEAGDLLAVDVVLKNTGYNNLDDLLVTTKISELGVQRITYFGDLVALECTDSTDSCDEDDKDTSRGRFYLQIPYDAESGIYTIEVEAKNSDLSVSEVSQVVIKNNLPSVAMKSGSDLLLVNPTNKLKVYKIVTPSDEQLVVLQAGSSKTVPMTVEANSNGQYDFEVNVFSGDELVDTVAFSGEAESKEEIAKPIVVLTVILSIIFIVLLIVLVVLIGKKPEKTEEFGESYY